VLETELTTEEMLQVQQCMVAVEHHLVNLLQVLRLVQQALDLTV
jgi:hypothetical protein